MTISTTQNRYSYNGNGVTTAFSYNSKFLANADLVVLTVVDATGVATTKVLDTDYTVAGAGVAGGGTVTFGTAPASGVTVVVYGDPQLTQPLDLVNNDNFDADDIEDQLDRQMLVNQRQADLIGRSFRLADSDTTDLSLELANLEANQLIGVNSAGTALEGKAVADVSGTVVSAFIGTLLDDSDAATARATLQAAGLGANTFTGVQRWAKGADVASAAALTLGTDGNYFDITGTTGITSIGTLGVGTVVKLHFDAALTLTHHATDLILPGGANITTAAGDEAEFVEYAAGDWRCTVYTKANGNAVVGQSFSPITASLSGDVSLNNTANYFDGPTIAQGSTGTWFVWGTVTVKDSTAGANAIYAKLWDGTTVIASGGVEVDAGTRVATISLSGYIVSPAGNLRISCRDATTTSGTIFFNFSGNSKDSTISAIRIA